MIPLPLGSALRRDLDRIHADERVAANAGDWHRAMERCCEAAAVQVEIAEEESGDDALAYADAALPDLQGRQQ